MNLFKNPPKLRDEDEKVDFFASAKISDNDPSTSTSTDSASSVSKETRTKGTIQDQDQEISEERKIKYKTELLSNDLEITMHALRAHPKVYWIWNHRKWCLEQLPEIGNQDSNKVEVGMKWKREIKVVEKMLELDPRNCKFQRELFFLSKTILNFSLYLQFFSIHFWTISSWMGLSTIPTF